MGNKTTQKKRRLGQRLAEALGAGSLASVAGRLAEGLCSVLPGAQTSFSLGRVLNLLGAAIARERARLAEAEAEVREVEHELERQRGLRDRATGDLRRKLIAVRRVVKNLFGDRGLEALLEGGRQVPHGGRALSDFGRDAFRRFFDQPRLPPSRLPGVELDMVQVAYSLDGPLTVLEDALDRIWFLERRLGAARSDRNHALARTEALVKPTESLMRALEDLASGI